MSFKLTGEAIKFTGPFDGVNGSYDLPFTRGAILRAALLTGRAPRNVSRFDEFSRNENRWRLATVRLALDLKSIPGFPPVPFRYNQQWGRLDGSEQAALNYSLGNIITKLVSEALLEAPLLLHHDVYRLFLRSSRRHQDRRPDFVAWSRLGADRWIAIEAKGRQRFPQNSARRKAKDQSGGLGSVRSHPIDCHAACWSYQRTGQIRFHLEDPPPQNPSGEDLNMTPSQMAAEYYRPVVSMVKAAQREGNREGLVVYRVPELDLQIGMEKYLAQALEDERPQDAAEYLGHSGLSATDIRMIDDEPIGLDGLAVIPGESWW